MKETARVAAEREEPTRRIARRPSEGLDDFDRVLMSRLQQDGRESNRALAAHLGANEATVASRLKRLEDAGIMRVVAVADMHAFGRNELVVALIRVSGRPVVDVATDITALPEAIAVTVTTGRFDLIVILLTRDHRQAAAVLAHDLAGIAGIDNVRNELALDILKYESKWAKLEPGADLSVRVEPHGDVDDLDVAILQQLQVDARQSNRKIAASLGVVEGTVRLRLKRMFDEQMIRIQAISDVVAVGLGAHAYVGIEVVRGNLEDVGAALRGHPQIAVLLRSLGEFDLMAVVLADDRVKLLEFVMGQIGTTPGVRHTETMESFLTLKHTATWARILA